MQILIDTLIDFIMQTLPVERTFKWHQNEACWIRISLFELSLNITENPEFFGNWALFSTLNISVNTASNLKFRVSFGILMTSRFLNWPWSLNLMKNWLRYSRLKTRLDFCTGSKKLKSSHFLESYQLSLSLNNLAKTSPNQTCRGCFGNLMTSRF